uniref:Fibronectin type III domain-containing protein n=1 Tax=Candidatus Kentrum sp. DK TaxID=2126562 RepID=A0A450SZ17_9GAMM|nr:MAG: Fibronectin type III domain-containing protein [Candidatus Kentron sp. DK]
MATFPEDEVGALELVRKMIRGLTDNSAIYPAPPTGPLDLAEKVHACEMAREELATIQSRLKQAFDTKETVMADLIDHAKGNLRYAEHTVDFDDAKLSMIGWGGRRPPQPLMAPGQATHLKAAGQGDGWIALGWRRPTDGGKVAYYCIECRKDEGHWQLAHTAMETEATLTEQERGKTLEYRVVAVNKAGRGEGSNAVTAVL